MATTQEQCLNCGNFRNDPRYQETAIPGLNCLSSGNASVRKDDGICLVRDQYLSADFWCDRYVALAQDIAAD